jgi:hypothetical protein
VHAAWARAARTRGFALHDLDDTLCPGGKSDDAIRNDGAHYSNEGADRVAPVLADRIRSLANARTTP